MRIRIMITPVLGPTPKEDPSFDSDSDSEPTSDIMSGLVEQMEELCHASEKIDGAILGLYARAKAETISWMHEPLKPTPIVAAWCKKNRVEATTIDSISDAIFAVAQMDYESRMLTFRRQDADMLWKGQQRLSIYEVIARIPTLFL
jgi:hypothetical protein